jgi:hypothetical protein
LKLVEPWPALLALVAIAVPTNAGKVLDAIKGLRK